MHTFDDSHHISTHELHEAIRDLGLGHHAEGYLMGQFDAHSHDGSSISGHGINSTIHQIKSLGQSKVGHEHLDKLTEKLQEHFEKPTDH